MDDCGKEKKVFETHGIMNYLLNIEVMVISLTIDA